MNRAASTDSRSLREGRGNSVFEESFDVLSFSSFLRVSSSLESFPRRENFPARRSTAARIFGSRGFGGREGRMRITNRITTNRDVLVIVAYWLGGSRGDRFETSTRTETGRAVCTSIRVFGGKWRGMLIDTV